MVARAFFLAFAVEEFIAQLIETLPALSWGQGGERLAIAQGGTEKAGKELLGHQQGFVTLSNATARFAELLSSEQAKTRVFLLNCRLS